jgi:uncharacterized membrane protein YedE/YeeE
MAHDPERRRFFAYLNLFVAAMLLLVLADNYLGLYMGWEGVGLASYLLIGFWSAQAQRRGRRQEGVRGQPGRRHRPGHRADGDVRRLRVLSLRRGVRRGARHEPRRTMTADRPAAAARRLR